MAPIPWGKFPTVAEHQVARRWLQFTANIGRAPNTIDAYGRAVEDHLRFCAAEATDPLMARGDTVAAWIRNMLDRPRTVGHASKGSLRAETGLANATIQQHPVARRQRGPLKAKAVLLLPVVRRRPTLNLLAGKQPVALTNRQGADSQFHRSGSTEEKPSRLDAADRGDADLPERLDERLDDRIERFGVSEDRPHIGMAVNPCEVLQSKVTRGFGHGPESPHRPVGDQPSIAIALCAADQTRIDPTTER